LLCNQLQSLVMAILAHMDAARDDLKFNRCLETISEDAELSLSTDCSEASGEDSPVSLDAADALLIFDWDDTLLPTSWISQQGWLNGSGDLVDRPDEIILTREQQVLLQELEVKVEQTLLTAMRHGRVIIVTNAADGWIETSCAAFLPGLSSLLDEIDLLSARSSYESCGENPMEWKRRAFADVIDAAFEYDESRPNVISIGDSVYEQAALASATKCMPNCCSKTLKLLESPDIRQLIEEHELLFQHLDIAVAHEDHLDLEVAPEMARRQ